LIALQCRLAHEHPSPRIFITISTTLLAISATLNKPMHMRRQPRVRRRAKRYQSRTLETRGRIVVSSLNEDHDAR
jgi:hypothetical protein